MSLTEHFATVADLRAAIIDKADRQPGNPEYAAPDLTADIEKLAVIVKQTPFSDTYRAMQRRIMSEFLQRLAAQPDFDWIVEHWALFSHDRRKQYLERTLSMLAETQSAVAGFPVKTGIFDWDDAMTVYGHAHFDVHNATGSTDRIVSQVNFSQYEAANAMDVVVHEQVHIFQAWLVRARLSGALKEDHPLYADSILAEKSMKEIYIPSRFYTAYRQQCVETDAFDVAEEAKRFVNIVNDLREAQTQLSRRKTGQELAMPLMFGMAVIGLAVSARFGGHGCRTVQASAAALIPA